MKIRHVVTLTLLLLVLVGFSFAQQSYRVVKVSGVVESPRLKRTLQIDDRIQENDQLKFENEGAYIIIIHPEKGRKTIKGVPDNGPKELSSLLQSFLRPDKKNTASRGLSEEYLEKLMSSLKDSVLILGNGKISLDSRFLNLAPPAVVKLHFQDDKKKEHFITVSKDQSIFLGKKEIALGDGKPKRMLLQYYKKEPAFSLDPGEHILGYFVPVYVDEEVVLSEVKVVASFYANETQEKLIEEIYKYLSAEYVPPHKLNLEDWLRHHHVIQ